MELLLQINKRLLKSFVNIFYSFHSPLQSSTQSLLLYPQRRHLILTLQQRSAHLNHVEKATDLTAVQPRGSSERGPKVNRAALDLQCSCLKWARLFNTDQVFIRIGFANLDTVK